MSKRRLIIIAGAAVLVLAVALAVAFPAYDHYQQRQLEQELAELQERIAECRMNPAHPWRRGVSSFVPSPQATLAERIEAAERSYENYQCP